MDILFILLLAIALDLAFGEPPNAIHPVAWMGKFIGLLERGNKSQSPKLQFLYGMLMVLLTLGIFTAAVGLILFYLKSFNFAAYIIVGAVLLKLSLSLKGLKQAAIKVRNLLQSEKPEEARRELRAMVSRETHHLPPPLLVSATVESVAENTVDSFIAPLFYFLLFGVPGAVAYRVVNTLDSMVGYHGKYEYLGKCASRLDDILNYIPARLAAMLLALAAFLSRKNGRAAWQVALREHVNTESPNAGWPMAATAGALNVQLEKVGQYKLGKTGNPLVPETIDASLELAQIAMGFWILLCCITGVVYFVLTA